MSFTLYFEINQMDELKNAIQFNTYNWMQLSKMILIIIGMIYCLYNPNIDKSHEQFLIALLIFMSLYLILEFIIIPYKLFVNEKYIVFKRIFGMKKLPIKEIETITTGLGIFRSPFYITFRTESVSIKIANQIQNKNKLLNYIKNINPSVKISKRLYT